MQVSEHHVRDLLRQPAPARDHVPLDRSGSAGLQRFAQSRNSAENGFRRPDAGTVDGMTDPEEQDPEVEQRLARELEPERHRAPSEGVPRDLPDDGSEQPPPS